jgi:hypothetical protein
MKRPGVWPSPGLVFVGARRLQLIDASVLSLGGDAFDDKCAGLRRAMPDRLDRLIGWRIVQPSAFSALSKASTTIRFDASPSRATVLPPRTR